MKGMFVVALVAIVAFASTTEAVSCPRENPEDVVLLPNPANCSTFFICDGGVPYLMECSKGLEFNPVEGVCDWPENAHCGVIVSTTEKIVEETTTDAPELCDSNVV